MLLSEAPTDPLANSVSVYYISYHIGSYQVSQVWNTSIPKSKWNPAALEKDYFDITFPRERKELDEQLSQREKHYKLRQQGKDSGLMI